MKRFVSLCLIILLAICTFASCAETTTPVTNTPEVSATPEISAPPHASPTPALTPAENFVEAASDDELNEIIRKATCFWADNYTFNSADEITSVKLFKFFTGAVTNEEMNQWYTKEDRLLYIPVKSVTAVLDQYFENYTFDPEKVFSGIDRYDKENDVLIVRSYGGGFSHEYKVDSESLSPSASPNPSSSPIETDSPSEATTLIFAEDDDTEAIFSIGMTREEVKQALTDNQMKIPPSAYGDSEEFILMTSSVVQTVDGIHVMYDNVTDLLCQVGISPVSDTELHSAYTTQKGLKIGDTVETLIELYGEPVKKVDSNDVYRPLSAYYYILPIDIEDYINAVAEVPRKPTEDSGEAFWDARGAIFRVIISQAEGDNFNKVTAIIYEA